MAIHVIFEMVRKLAILFYLTVIGGSNFAHAQNFLSWQYTDRYFSLALGTGKAMYLGELNQPNRIQTNLANYPLALEVRLWTRIAGKAEVAMYKINGADHLAPETSFERQRNLSFESWNFESSISGVFYFKPYNLNYHRRWRTDPYVSLGVGMTTVNPKAELNKKTYTLRDFQTEGESYSRISAVIPVAAGVKFRINPFINFVVEAAFRYTFTDYLDDVSTVFPETTGDNIRSQLANRKNEIPVINQEAYDRLVAGEKRGDPSNNDHYAFLNFKLEFFLPNSLRGPLFQKPSAF